ncbi:hypothetical protein FGB62_76g0116 [Gracilaria domingensis]|nr:hypothetical protein FGB62_76g0116 [Gracilaria domingensis]
MPTLTRRLSTLSTAPLTQDALPTANAQPALQLSAPLSSSPNPASARNTQNPAVSRQTARAASSAHPPFPAYNRSPMVCTVLSKKRKSGKPTNRASSLQTESPTHAQAPNRSPDASTALPKQPHRTTNANHATIPPTLSLPRSPTKSVPTVARKDRPRSPSSPVKPPHATKKLSPTDEAYAKEKRKALGDLVERRNAHRREKSTEKSHTRPLTPISKLIEDTSRNKPASPPKKSLNTEVQASSVRVENAQIEAPTVANMVTADIANPSPSVDGVRRRNSSEKSLVNSTGVRTVSNLAEKGLQSAQREKRELRPVGDHYLTLIKSLFTLVAQVQQEGRRNDGLTGEDLSFYMKKRVLAAFATHTRERDSVLNKKALKLLTQLQLCKSDVARLARLTNTEVRGAVQPVRRSKKSEVRREDIAGLRAMLLSWERFSGGQKAHTDQFHLDAVHLKCIAEALEDGTRVSISNNEAFILFKELVLVNSGISLIYDTIGGLKAVYMSGNRECVRPWFRSTDGIITWHVYMRRRMVELLAIADEPFASELKKYCTLFSHVSDEPNDSKLKQKVGEGIKIGRRLRELKKQIKSLWQDEQGNELRMEDEYCHRTTSNLTQASKSFAKLVKYMTTLSATPKVAAERNADGSGGSSREGSPEKAKRRDDSESGARRKNSVIPRQAESRARREESKGSLNKGIELKGAVKHGGTSEENARSRAINDVRAASDDARKRGVVEERRMHADRSRGREGDGANKFSSRLSIPRRPAKEDSGGAGGGVRGGGVRSNGSAVADAGAAGACSESGCTQVEEAEEGRGNSTKARKRDAGRERHARGAKTGEADRLQRADGRARKPAGGGRGVAAHAVQRRRVVDAVGQRGAEGGDWRAQRAAVAGGSRDVLRLPAHVCVAAKVHEGRARVRHAALPAQPEHAVRRARAVAESAVDSASAALAAALG